MLVRSGKEWDADMILRAVMEGSMKLLYMLSGTPTEVEVKVDEFCNVLPEIGRIRHHERARRFLDAFPDAEPEVTRPLPDLVIEEAAVERIHLAYSKKQRLEIERRWSLLEMSRTWTSPDQQGLDRALVLAHGYGMSIHILHKDGDGVGMIWERTVRSPQDRLADTLTHGARLVSDVCELAALRTSTAFRVNGFDPKTVADIRFKYEALLMEPMQRA